MLMLILKRLVPETSWLPLLLREDPVTGEGGKIGHISGSALPALGFEPKILGFATPNIMIFFLDEFTPKSPSKKNYLGSRSKSMFLIFQKHAFCAFLGFFWAYNSRLLKDFPFTALECELVLDFFIVLSLHYFLVLKSVHFYLIFRKL